MIDQEHQDFRHAVRQMVRKHVMPIADEIENSGDIPPALLERFREMGLLQLRVPAEFGGPGGDLLSAVIAREEVAMGGSMGLAQLASQNGIVVEGILAAGAKDLESEIFPRLVEGGLLTCIALSETDLGSDPALLQSKAVRDGSDWVINGTKQFITWGGMAHYALVFARTNPMPRSKGISAFLVDTNQPGWQVTKSNSKMGQHAVPNNEILLDDVRVPAGMMVGPEGGGFGVALQGLQVNRLTVSAIAVGGAQCALNYAIDYAKRRPAGDGTIADYQGLRWMIADAAAEIEALRALVYAGAIAYDSGADADTVKRYSSMAKLIAAKTVENATSVALQVLGGHGYMTEHPVERYVRDARLIGLYEGTNEIQRNIIARLVID